MRISVHAFKVAALRDIHDHDWSLILGELKQVGGKFRGFPSIPENIRWFYCITVELGYTYQHLLLFTGI